MSYEKRDYTFVATFIAMMLSASAFAYSFEVDGIYYHYPGGSLEVYVSHEVDYVGENSPRSYSGAVVISPAVTYEGTTYTVVGIHDEAFYGCEDLTSVTIPNTIEEIYQFAFRGCVNLTSINGLDLNTAALHRIPIVRYITFATCGKEHKDTDCYDFILSFQL